MKEKSLLRSEFVPEKETLSAYSMGMSVTKQSAIKNMFSAARPSLSRVFFFTFPPPLRA